MEPVLDSGDLPAEYTALRTAAGVLDLSFRSRLCLLGADRQRFLHGQVTNDVLKLKVGRGCYAALVTAKGRLVSDLNIYCLPDELLLDFEPGLAPAVVERLEKYIIADDVQVVDVAAQYGLLSIQGPRSAAALAAASLSVPVEWMSFTTGQERGWGEGEVYCMNRPRGTAPGFDLFVPVAALSAAKEQLTAAVQKLGGRACGWQALEMVRIEAGLPRYGQDMDDTNLAPEAGIEGSAISYEKGCYIGQEVIARLRTYGQVAKALRGLVLPDDLVTPPARGEKLFRDGKDVGYVTSVLVSPALQRTVALGYVRRECNQPGTELQLLTSAGPRPVRIVPLPFSFDPRGC